jgi:hypothetical protein
MVFHFAETLVTDDVAAGLKLKGATWYFFKGGWIVFLAKVAQGSAARLVGVADSLCRIPSLSRCDIVEWR